MKRAKIVASAFAVLIGLFVLDEVTNRAIKALVVRHARKITFQLAEVAMPRNVFGQILGAIHTLKSPPRPA